MLVRVCRAQAKRVVHFGRCALDCILLEAARLIARKVHNRLSTHDALLQQHVALRKHLRRLLGREVFECAHELLLRVGLLKGAMRWACRYVAQSARASAATLAAAGDLAPVWSVRGHRLRREAQDSFRGSEGRRWVVSVRASRALLALLRKQTSSPGQGSERHCKHRGKRGPLFQR